MDKTAILKKYEEIVAACNRCGFCTSYCPTYNATGNETHSPRGRNQMVRALIEGKVSNPTQAKESIDTCLLCGECTSVCFSEVPTAELMVQARSYLNQTMGVPPLLSFFLRKILAHPKRYFWFLKTSFFFKRIGVPALLRKLNLLSKISPTLTAADELMPTVPSRFLSEEKAAAPFLERNWAKQAQLLAQTKDNNGAPTVLQRPKVALMPLCGSGYLLPEIGLSLIQLLRRLRVDFVVPDVLCCGLPAASYGVTEQVSAMAEENIRRIERGHFDALLVDDSSCGAHLKDYPKYLQTDARWMQRAHELSQKVKDMSQFLIQRGLKDHLKMVPWEGGLVAFHDPCKAQYGQKITQSPRELLFSIPRLAVVNIPDSDQCCGGGGTYSFVHPEISKDVLAAKIKNITATKCQIVVTSSASCLIQLRAGLREAKSKIEAMHLSAFLLRALEKKR